MKKGLVVLFIIISLVFVACSKQSRPVQVEVTKPVTTQTDTNPPKKTIKETPQPEKDQATNTPADATPTAKTPNETTNLTDAPSKVSLSELAKHNSESDCWVAFQGQVYDITKFLPIHPGGIRAIASRCGTNDQFEKAFLGKHGTSKIPMLKSQGILEGELSN